MNSWKPNFYRCEFGVFLFHPAKQLSGRDTFLHFDPVSFECVAKRWDCLFRFRG